MAKKNLTPGTPSKLVKAPKPKPPKPKAVEVKAPDIYKGEGGTLYPLDVKDGAFLTTDSDMDNSDITVQIQVKDGGEPQFEDIVDTSGTSGARKIPIPLNYITSGMGHTLLFSFKGTVAGQPAQSRVSEVEVRFYDEKDLEGFAPEFVHSEPVHNTPTLDMYKFSGNETIQAYAHPLIKEGDQFFVNVAGDQDKTPFAFNNVAFSRVVTAAEAVPGHVFRLSLPRGWMGRRRPWGSLTIHWGWICDGRAPLPPADVDPILETRLPENALEGRPRPTSALIVDPRLENMPRPHLRQSVLYDDEWCLNPELTKDGGDVDVSGLDIYEGDQICFYVSGPDDGSKPLGCVTIEKDGDRASIKLSPCDVACFFNKPMMLTYTVQFPSGGEPQLSPEQMVNVLLPQFPHSQIEQATGNTLDLSTFPADATAFVPVWDYAECSKCCWMWITGEHEDGSAYRFDILMDAPVTDVWKANGINPPILRAELQKLADCSEFDLHFAVSFCDKCDLASAHEFPVQTFKIEQGPMVLIEPTVREAVLGQLTAYNGRTGVHVEVNYVGNNPKHAIIVCWKRPNGSCWLVASQPGSTTGAVIWLLPPEAVIESMGTAVEITYTVTTACKVQTSPPLNLKISLPVRLETPNVLEATPPKTQNAVLDLRTFTGNANSIEEPMWFLRAGQKAWLRTDGTDKNGNPYSFNVYSARAITAAEETVGVAGPVLRPELDKLMDATPLTLTFSLSTDGSSNVNVVCPPRVLNLVAPPEIRYENFTTEPTRIISAGQSISTPTMRINFLSGPGPAGIDSYSPTPGLLEGQAIVLCRGADQNPKQHLRLDLAFECKRVKFAYTWSHLHTVLTFYSASGVYLGVVNLNGANIGSPLHGWVDFSTPGSSKIGRIEIHSGDYMFFDFFTFWL
ncbi:hypothetical protein SAMN04490182_3623 [Pseudomonas cedrina]|uniref:Uncharacterized protein n=2 Tax=Pseudomonas cedrina TaxID=651740 RepID=A0A1V2K4D8_PSECE|nr:hypothetical protein [Pseudomonas cedrina]ONH52255.1 hypothetical protein BLL36_19435 [Pseudomonas cedrina subsp. cedrina]SDT20662.1 hypothetical protein SAMN04490182_3623 [Pseudomonas cedrina]